MRKKCVCIISAILAFIVCMAPVSASSLPSLKTDHSGPGRLVFSAAAEEKTESADEKETPDQKDVQKAVDAYQSFIDGKKEMIFHEDKTVFACFPGSSYFRDGEKYLIDDLASAFVDGAVKTFSPNESDTEAAAAESIKYAVLESDSLPLLAVTTNKKAPYSDILYVCFIMYYDPVTDEIHLALGEDSWNKISVQVNRSGIVCRYVTYSAFEEAYDYRRVTGSGDIEPVYDAFFDNTAIYNSDLSDDEKEIHLVKYYIPSVEEQSGQGKKTEFYTLHKLLSGDTTFVYEKLVSTSDDDSVAALYSKDGIQLEPQRKIMEYILASMKKMGLTPEEFFADEPEWIIKK